ncbi:MAG: Crp/Fnr family transcriptional regulator [Bacilli bacterium]|nr:Crp/Fnr family transcriptional regulator [Bacilli bacterium]
MKKNDSYCTSCKSPCFVRMDVLSGLSEEQQKELLKAARKVILKKGELVFSEGDPANSFFLIHKGSMRLVNYDSEGNERAIATFFAGEAIWESLFLGRDATYPYSAVAGDDLEFCAIERNAFEHVVSTSSTSLRIISLLSQKLHDANERARVLSLSSPKSRIAAHIIYRAERQESKIITMRLSDLASSLSLRPETVSRKLQELIKERAIKKISQSAFIVLDFEKLEFIAQN